MLVAAILAAGSALLGGALALLARQRPTLLELTRTFAFAAAGGVVAFHLLPEALPGLGVSALLWIAAGFALPWIMEFSARIFGPGLLAGRGLSGKRVAAEVGFVALFFHSVVEGLALAAALRAPEGRRELEVALVAHHAPLTAAVILPFLQLLGARPAALRVVALACAGLGGVLLAGYLPALAEGADATNLQRATAVTAGILLHVVSDEIRTQSFASRWERAADLGASLAGILLAGLSVVLHLRASPGATPVVAFLRALATLWLASAPALLVGALAWVALLRFSPRSARLRLDELLLTLALLGPLAALLRTALATALALTGPRWPTPPARSLLLGLRPRAPWLVVLLVVAAAALVVAPPLPALSSWAVLLLLMAARADGTFATPLAAVLVQKGFHPGAALALLALGPHLRGSLRQMLAPVAVAAAVVALSALGLPARLVQPNRSLATWSEPIAAQLASAPLASLAGAAMLLLVLSTVWAAGARGWFAPLRHGDGAPRIASLSPVRLDQ